VTFTATLSKATGDTISWSLSADIGSLSTTSGTTTRYTPPGEVTSQTVVTLSATAGSLRKATSITIKPETSGPQDWYQPTTGITWQWQLQGEVNTSYEVDLYDIDLFEVPESTLTQLKADGRRVICYFSAGSFEDWRPDAADFAEADLGTPLDGFPDERWLDIRSDGVREIMRARLDLAQQRGCDGVEPDNVQMYLSADTGFSISAQDQLEYNRFLATEAHQRSLAIGLKNDLEQLAELAPDFDFAVNEQCFEFDECAAYEVFIGADKAVLNAEYAAIYVTDANSRADLCQQSEALGFHTLVLPEDLDDSFRLDCRE
jgi:hypothetical protein